jgi:hypothetical protein
VLHPFRCCCLCLSLQVIGHLAAARTTAKLNLVSSRVFPLPAGVRAPLAAMEANADLMAGDAAGVAAAEPSALVPASTATAEPASITPGSDSLGGQPREGSKQQVHEAQQPGVEAASGPASTAGGASTAAIGGLVHVRHVSVARWQQPPAQKLEASATAAAAGHPKQPQLVLESGEGFAAAAGFDAATVQHEVQEQRQGLLEQLEQLLHHQQQGLLPGQEQLAAAGAPALQCTQNRVAPPTPPPLPASSVLSAPPAAVSGHGPGWPNGSGLQQQPPPPQQQQQQPRIMRPLYQVPGAEHSAPQLQLLAHAQQWQLHGGVQPPPPPSLPAHGGPHPWAAGGLAAAVITAAQQQQPQLQQRQVEHPPAPEPKPALNNNKRAAEGLKARLQGMKRPRQQDGVPGIGEGPSDAQPQQQPPPQQQPSPVPQWLEGAPSAIRQLAAPEASAAGPEVLFLGTGSAEPSKYRAASAIQLRCASLLLPADACEDGFLACMQCSTPQSMDTIYKHPCCPACSCPVCLHGAGYPVGRACWWTVERGRWGRCVAPMGLLRRCAKWPALAACGCRTGMQVRRLLCC